MIDWEEFFEDFNWKRAAAFLVGMLVLIVVGVFLILDYHRAKLLTSTMLAALNEMEDVEPPPKKELDRLAEDIKKWDAVLAKSGWPRQENPEDGLILPIRPDISAMQNSIQQTAARNNLRILRISPKTETSGDFLKIFPFEVSFERASYSGINAFIKGLPEPHGVKKEMTEMSGPVTIVVEFYVFDQESWDRANDCQDKFAIPEPPPEITGSYLFKNWMKLEDLRAEVEQKMAGLTDTRKKLQEKCRLGNEISRRKRECEIVSAKLVNSLKCEIE